MFWVYIVIAYLLGSISPSIVLGKMSGVDIRKEGSGNAGTTNTLRVLGKKAAIITLLIDAGKGAMAVFLGSLASQTCSYICAAAVMAGHIWPVFYGFKGGKGVATAFGAVLMINWKMALLLLALTLVLTALSKRMSVGSIGAAVGLPILSIFMENGFWPYALGMALVVIYKHKGNIQRLLKGEEPKLNFKK